MMEDKKDKAHIEEISQNFDQHFILHGTLNPLLAKLEVQISDSTDKTALLISIQELREEVLKMELNHI